MWFVLVGGVLVALVAVGLYARRRLTEALLALDVRPARVRAVRWLAIWLLFAYPAFTVVGLIAQVGFQVPWPRLDGRVGALLFTVPFAWTALVAGQSAIWLLVIDAAWFVRRRRPGAPPVRLRAVAMLVVLGAFAIYTPARILLERDALSVRRHELHAGTPTGAARFRMVFLADIQESPHVDGARARQVYAIASAEKPDVVFYGGDWIDRGPEYIDDAAASSTALQSRLGTWSVLGDHEHFAFLDRDRSVIEVRTALERKGVRVRADQVQRFEHGGRQIAVLFLNYNYIHRTAPATVDALLTSLAGADYRIVVSHQLDDQLAAQLEDRVDLVLAGHTHGGQVHPVVGLRHVPLARIETRYIDGRYSIGKTTAAIITAGIGYSVVPFRYASPGSLEVIDLFL